jgi:hypothetical protein
LIVGDLKISHPVDRLGHVAFWKRHREELENQINVLGAAGAGPAWEDLVLMHDLEHHTYELLKWMDDVLMPREPFIEQTIEAVTDLLLTRAADVELTG